MKKNTFYLKRTLLLATMMFILGCETGVQNTKTQETTTSGIVESGIIDNDQINTPTNANYSIQKSTLIIQKIFSNSGTPGYYLQIGFFEHNRPNNTFINRLKNSGLPYTILEKDGNYYALIGAYLSYNQAKSKTSIVHSKLNPNAFIIEVLRP